MSVELKAPRNPNYCATVVRLEKFVDLPNCDNVKAALIFGNSVIVSKSTQAGEVGIFFPVECQLNKEFLGANNLYRKPELGNVDPEKKGYFEHHGRIKAVKFRGHKSEGFYIPISALTYIDELQLGEAGFGCPIDVGATFDAIGDHEICRKYIPRMNVPRERGPRAKVVRLEDQIVENQFRFHYDTQNLRRNIDQINPEDYISISDKWHGTSAVIANVAVKRPLPWYERLLKWLGVGIWDEHHGLVYSSRCVVKYVNGQTKHSNHFYGSDIWGVVAKEIYDVIPKGFTVYGEIVGYTTEGSSIQKGYHYGCQPGQHLFLVYRVTTTNADGYVVELSWLQMREFCMKYGLTPVVELWYGKAKDLFEWDEDYDFTTEAWREFFLQNLEKTYVRDEMCMHNNFEVPAEGIVLRIDKLNECVAFKLKNFKFLEHETKLLDKGEVDVETAESQVEEAA